VKISRKLVLSLLAACLPVVLGSVAATMLIQGKLEALGGFHSNNLRLSQAIGIETLAAVEESFAYVASGLDEEKEVFLKWTRTFPARMEELARSAHLDRPEEMPERDLHRKILAEHGAAVDNAQNMFREYESTGRLSRSGFERYEGAVNRLRGAIDRFIQHEEREVEKSQAQAVGAIKWSEAVIVALAALSTLLLVVVGIVISRAICKPILVLRSATQRIESGDSDVRIASNSRDEVGDLSRSVASMVRDLNRRRHDLAEANAGLVQQAAELQRSNAELQRFAKELRDSEEKFRQMAEHIEEVFWSVSPDLTRIHYISPACEKIWGRSQAEMIRNPEAWAQAIHPGDRERIWRLAFEMRSTGRFQESYRIVQPDGSIRWIYAHGTCIHNAEGAVTNMVGSALDITSLKAAEEDLVRSNVELERFAYVAAHDLQEPLRSVSSFLQLLQRKYKGRLEADADEYIQFAVDGAHRMKQLIGDLLAYSRLNGDARPMELAPLDGMVDIALENLRGVIQESGAKITRDLLPDVEVDGAQVAQVFQNLIGNAIKFRGDRAPEIHVGAKRSGPGWTITVRDNGIGIDSKYAERIFVIFQRLNGQKYPGSGIGLTVSRKIVEHHRGRIWVESTPGEGATFSFTIPDPGKAMAPPSPAPAGARVLVVDDDPVVCLLIRKNLAPLGMAVEEAHTGPGGLEMAARTRPDLVVLDINLPGLSGLDVLQSLKGNSETRTIPVVLITGREELLSPGLAASQDWFPKPLPLTDFRKKVLSLVPSGKEGPN
jgi:PAS domain S-box-containing protein